jgi:ATP-dependent helicase/nuclease subunit B
VGGAEFEALLTEAEEHLKRMGQQIYSGCAEVGPYRRGLTTACDQCGYQAICRIDPWTHEFRVLRPAAKGAASALDDEGEDVT